MRRQVVLRMTLFGFLSCVMLLGACGGAAAPQTPLWMALDLGNEWLKACIINPRAPPIGLLDVVINEQSNRKTPALIGVDNEGNRVFGEAALSLTTRNPGKVFPGLKRLLGQSLSSQAVTDFKADYAGHHKLEAAAGRDSVSFSVGDESLSVEELAATLFRITKRMAADHATVQVAADTAQIAGAYDAVVTVPESFSAAQRELVKQLAAIGDVNVKLVLNDLSAAAVDYGVRVFKADATTPNGKTSKHIIFYGAGSHGVAANLVEYTLTGNNVKVRVLATAYESSTGGLKLDRLVRDRLAKRFDELHKVKQSDASNEASIFSSKKAMAKLLREARETKEQLSASALFQLIIEELFNGKDFTTTVTREELEGWLKEAAVLGGFVKPIDSIVARLPELGVKPESIEGIELFGGAVRVPAVQNAVKEAHPNLALGRHIDGDEAALLGAAYLANQLRTAAKPDASRTVVTLEEPESLYPASSGSSALSEESLSSVKQQIAAWERAVQERQAWDAAKNALETVVVELKGQIEGKKLVVKGGGEKLTEELYAITNDILENYDARSAYSAADLQKRLDGLNELVKTVKSTVQQPKEKAKVVEDDKVDPDAEARNAEARARRKREKEKRTKQAEKDKAAKAKATAKKTGRKEDL